ncbi:intermediate filament protein ON3-like [Genypterus blacodes]|uniref:intermediate filament protein ON3-like n=1 Tax=Genypterus blacodes TaxID=154954 RepID=UPI003F759C29
MSKPGGYSSQSYSPAGRAGATKSYPTVGPRDPDLLTPIKPHLDPQDQTAKAKEKDQMVGLNDKFVALIDKVKHLEDKNKVLETRLKLLKEQDDYKGDINDIVRQLENELLQQVDGLIRDQAKLEAEVYKNQAEVDKTKQRYENELEKKAELENDFILTKNDVDEGHLGAVKLALELEDLMGKLEFLRLGFDEEIKELESQVQNKTVIIRNSCKRSLDMDEIVENFKKQYADMASRSREDCELWNQKKMDAMIQNAGQREQDVREVKKDISDMLRLIQRLNAELESLRKKKENAEKDVEDMEVEGQKNLDQARGDIVQLEEALRRAKHDMARQIRDYQELMNLKLALDIEIATYRKLLEGEEQRMESLTRQSDY